MMTSAMMRLLEGERNRIRARMKCDLAGYDIEDSELHAFLKLSGWKRMMLEYRKSCEERGVECAT